MKLRTAKKIVNSVVDGRGIFCNSSYSPRQILTAIRRVLRWGRRGACLNTKRE